MLLVRCECSYTVYFLCNYEFSTEDWDCVSLLACFAFDESYVKSKIGWFILGPKYLISIIYQVEFKTQCFKIILLDQSVETVVTLM